MTDEEIEFYERAIDDEDKIIDELQKEKVKQIFEILGLEPEEEFKLDKPFAGCHYKLDNELYLYYFDDKGWHESGIHIADIIKYGIIKIPQKSKLTNKDKVAIKFLKNCGFHYVARDKDMELYAYSNKPYRESIAGFNKWVITGGVCTKVSLFMQNNIFGSISWKDDGHKSLFCLDDFTDKELKED